MGWDFDRLSNTLVSAIWGKKKASLCWEGFEKRRMWREKGASRAKPLGPGCVREKEGRWRGRQTTRTEKASLWRESVEREEGKRLRQAASQASQMGKTEREKEEGRSARNRDAGKIDIRELPKLPKYGLTDQKSEPFRPENRYKLSIFRTFEIPQLQVKKRQKVGWKGSGTFSSASETSILLLGKIRDYTKFENWKFPK